MKYTRDQLIDRIRQTAQQIGFPPNVAVVQLARESANFADRVVYGPYVAGAGERGLAQFTPGTWSRFGVGMHTNAYDPDASLAAWAGYTSYLMRLFNGDLTKVLQGYNGGEGHLTDPGKYGPVSSMAKRYASEILTQAGAAEYTNGTGGSDGDELFGFPTWAVIGTAALLVVVVLLDD